MRGHWWRRSCRLPEPVLTNCGRGCGVGVVRGIDDYGLAAQSSVTQCLQGVRRLGERGGTSDDGPQHAVVDEPCHVAQLLTAGMHEQEFVVHAEAAGLLADPAAEACDGQAEYRVEARLPREGWVRGPCDSNCLA